MPQEPQIKALSNRERTWLFWLLFAVFLVSLPAVIFYTTGYRLQFTEDATEIVTTGGLYVDTDLDEVQVYLNEDAFLRPRLFRNAYYLQNVPEGVHRVVVQAPGLHTWVKELPVSPRIVTEARAFNVPVEPQLRPITRFETADNIPVYRAASSTLWGVATATEPFLTATTTATTSLVRNPEFIFVDALFASTSSTSVSVFADNDAFRFMTPRERARATTTSRRVVSNDIELLDTQNEVFAVWLGPRHDIPHYYCVSNGTASSTAAKYGQHVADQIEALNAASISTTSNTSVGQVFNKRDQTCRSAIQLNRLRQDVYWYGFMPGSNDEVLLHLEDGLYVTEIDDRAWQNTQPLLPISDVRVLVENGIIYVLHRGFLFELVPTLADS